MRGQRYLVRWQSPELSEADLHFRHAFMAHLRDAGLPVPGLLARPDGTTHAITDNGVYEVQEWLDGRQFATEDGAGEADLEAAARMLGRLHQASADFQWQPYRWPEERSADELARSYIALIDQATQREGIWLAVKSGLTRIAEVLNVPVAFFFGDHAGGGKGDDASEALGFLETSGAVRLVKAYAQIDDTDVRRALVDLAESIAAGKV